ncbi:MAG: cysteine hydrolase family protein [Bacteroidales bacterium]
MKKILFILCMMVSQFTNAQQVAPNSPAHHRYTELLFCRGSSELLKARFLQASMHKKLLASFRQSGQLVIHIKHGDGKGAEIHPNVAPADGEKVIVKKEVNSFLKTDLLEYLQKNQVKKLVLCGMQTNMCLEAATRAAADLGFECVVIHDACAAKNQVFNGRTVKAEDVHAAALATLKAYATIISTEAYLEGGK